jgi:hypothetical protein
MTADATRSEVRVLASRQLVHRPPCPMYLVVATEIAASVISHIRLNTGGNENTLKLDFHELYAARQGL